MPVLPGNHVHHAQWSEGGCGGAGGEGGGAGHDPPGGVRYVGERGAHRAAAGASQRAPHLPPPPRAVPH